MALLQGASASSSSPLWRYQVFLSFRGEDTRNNFTAHLYQALDRKGINTYIDNNLERGEEISPALFEAVEGSKIAIIILSPHYASSTWCLKELMKILDCKETKQQIVLPVFYYVDPSDVRHQTNTFEEAFAKHEVRFKDDKENVQRWKAALTEVSNLSGFHLKKEMNEFEFICDIIKWVDKSIIPYTSLSVAKYPVGIESRVDNICSHLCVGMNDIRMVGILGCGGIGKTTIAKAINNLIANHFEATCFLPNVRETSATDGLVKLQEKLLSKILGDSNLKVDTEDRGINLIKERICRKRILLILDDVDQLKQLEKLAGERDWFGSGSRIIITTRDRNVLTNHDVDFTYEVERLNSKESLQLFNLSAFKGDNPSVVEYKELLEQIINYAGGLPLALHVLGSDLCGKSICEWRSALRDYQENLHQDIQKVLRISYDGLSKNEKKIFLDIACFFKGKRKKDVIKILNDCGFSAEIGIRRLMDKGLITTSSRGRGTDHKLVLEMHDLLQEMGREVVREESPEEPGGRSRLWFHEDVRMILEENMGTNKIEAIQIDLPRDNDIIQLSPDAFMRMKRLRLFINHNARFSEEVNSLPNETRVLIWPGYHCSSLPSNFHGKKLMHLIMPRSLIQDVRMEHTNLISLNFSYCKLLTKISNLSRHANLKELILSCCSNLEEIYDSVGQLYELVRLDLHGCFKLRSFARSIKLRSLEDLDLDGCSSLLNFPEVEGEMKTLYGIKLYRSGIKELPSSIRNISGLRWLDLMNCNNLTHLPVSLFQLPHLESLSIDECPLFRGFGEKLMEDNRQFVASIVPDREYEISGSPPTNSSISNDDCCNEAAVQALEFLSLENLVLSKSNCFTNSNWQPNLSELILSRVGIVSLPAGVKTFVRLRGLYLYNCEQLQEIPELPQNIKQVEARGCISLEIFPRVSKKFEFDTSEDVLDKLISLDLRGSHKMLKKLRNPVLSPSLRMYLRRPVYCQQEIPIKWFSLLEGYVLDGLVDSVRGLPTWFSYGDNPSFHNHCRINVNWQECLDKAITIALCAVIIFRPKEKGRLIGKISAYASVVREGHFLRRVEGTTVLIGNELTSGAQHLFLAYTTVEPSEVEGNYLQVVFSASSNSGAIEIASCEVHRVHEHKERLNARKRKNENKERSREQMDVSNAEPENVFDLSSMIQLYQICRGRAYWGNHIDPSPRPTFC